MTRVTRTLKCIAFGAATAAALTTLPDASSAGIDPYLGDIIAVGETFCPRGWADANGALLPIAQYTALFSLLGTTYGGDGRTTFGLPDLQGRIAMGQGNGPGLTPRDEGQKFGSETKVIQESQLPSHSHAVNANNLDGDRPGPGGKLLAAAPPSGAGSETIYSDQPPTRTMNTAMIANSGGSQPINTESPFLVMRYCIAIEGQYPSRN